MAAPGAPFTATTATIARDSIVLRLSVDFALDDGVTLFAGWQGALAASSSVQSVRAGLRMTW